MPTETNECARERPIPRGVMLLGLPRAQIRFLMTEALRAGTRPSEVAETIIGKEMRDRECTEHTTQ
jgi:hypothetical protein